MSEKQENFTLLNGKVIIERSFYNPTSDAVWLAAYAPTNAKDVLDVGVGTGGASLCLLKHNPNANITGLDISDKMLDECAKNFALNKKNVRLLKQDIFEWNTTECFDLVITNPPYFNGTPTKKHKAHHNVNIKLWTKRCCARVRPNGYFCIIIDALRMEKVIPLLEDKHFGHIDILPLFGSKNTAERVLIRAKLGCKTGTRIFKGLSMNNDSILRDGLTIDTLLATLDTL
jgi:tRNA1(Val) A37 N6-methylase TrmN6